MSEKYGFVYIWFDKKHKRYYVGCRWGREDDGYVCSSSWMKQAYGHRPNDFKRRILVSNIRTREETYQEEQRWLNMIKEDEIKPIAANPRYYNLCIKNNKVWHSYESNIKSIGQKISATKRAKQLKFGPMSEERRRKISEAKKAKGRKFTEEHKQKLREAKLGKKLSKEHRDKVVKTLKYYKG